MAKRRKRVKPMIVRIGGERFITTRYLQQRLGISKPSALTLMRELKAQKVVGEWLLSESKLVNYLHGQGEK